MVRKLIAVAGITIILLTGCDYIGRPVETELAGAETTAAATATPITITEESTTVATTEEESTTAPTVGDTTLAEGVNGIDLLSEQEQNELYGIFKEALNSTEIIEREIEGITSFESDTLAVTALRVEQEGIEVRVMLSVQNKTEVAIDFQPMYSGVQVNGVAVPSFGSIIVPANGVNEGFAIIPYNEVILTGISKIEKISMAFLTFNAETGENIVCCEMLEFQVK